jgi:hypothetical protein
VTAQLAFAKTVPAPKIPEQLPVDLAGSGGEEDERLEP